MAAVLFQRCVALQYDSHRFRLNNPRIGKWQFQNETRLTWKYSVSFQYERHNCHDQFVISFIMNSLALF